MLLSVSKIKSDLKELQITIEGGRKVARSVYREHGSTEVLANKIKKTIVPPSSWSVIETFRSEVKDALRYFC